MRGKSIGICLLCLITTCFLLTSCTQSRQAYRVEKTSFTADSMRLKAPADPVFESSFIQYWYCQNFDRARWNKELSMLKELGINEVILQTTVDTKLKHATYPTSMEGYSHNDIDMLETVLSEADELKIKVRIGIGFNDEWWGKRATDQVWLRNEADANKAIINEIQELYGQHQSFTGWYIPHEFCQFTAITGKQQSNLNYFFRDMASQIKLKSPGKDIMVSPFYYGKLSLPSVMPIWSGMLKNILNETGIDIIALQDSVGVHYNETDDLKNLFSYTKMAADDMGIKLYSVTETFTTESSTNVPAPQESIMQQLSLVKEYVQGFAAFSINHFQNLNEALQADNFEDYKDYYIQAKNKVPAE